jgi:hypothetical protein
MNRSSLHHAGAAVIIEAQASRPLVSQFYSRNKKKKKNQKDRMRICKVIRQMSVF